MAGSTIRNDNGPSFEAMMVREFLKDKGGIRKSIHVATSEDNANAEAFHIDIIERHVADRFGFGTFHPAEMVFCRLFKRSNFWLKHGSPVRVSPERFLKGRA